MPLGAYSKAWRKDSSLARRACCSRSRRTRARCMLERSRALMMAMAAWEAYMVRASWPQAPGRRPPRGRSTEITPISSPSPPEAYIGAYRRSLGCHSSAKRGSGPSVCHCGTSSSVSTQPSWCGMKWRAPQRSPIDSRRSHEPREPTRPVIRASAAVFPANAATTRSPSGRTRFTHASSYPRPVTMPSATACTVSDRLRAVLRSATTWCSCRRVARRTYGSDSASMTRSPRPRQQRQQLQASHRPIATATESQRAALSVHRVNN
ncbi:hypothetical protein SSPIM334S_03356 [Streptomyces spiroverticillatus]